MAKGGNGNSGSTSTSTSTSTGDSGSGNTSGVGTSAANAAGLGAGFGLSLGGFGGTYAQGANSAYTGGASTSLTGGSSSGSGPSSSSGDSGSSSSDGSISSTQALSLVGADTPTSAAEAYANASRANSAKANASAVEDSSGGVGLSGLGGGTLAYTPSGPVGPGADDYGATATTTAISNLGATPAAGPAATPANPTIGHNDYTPGTPASADSSDNAPASNTSVYSSGANSGATYRGGTVTDNGSGGSISSGITPPSRDTSSIGLGVYNPDKANYDQDNWNRGMEVQSSSLVSDEECKAFAKRAFSENTEPFKKVRVTIIKKV